MNRLTPQALLSFALLLSIAPSARVSAQPSAGSGELEEITVTATRQAASIQDVPVSVSALDQSAITQFGISSIEISRD